MYSTSNVVILLQKQGKKFFYLCCFCLFPLFFSTTSLASASSEDKNLQVQHNIMIGHDQRPTDLEYALMSKYSYEDLEEDEEKEIAGLPNWRVYAIRKGNSGYYGVVFHNKETHQLVLAHRGTNSLESLWEDIRGIVLKQYDSQQKIEAYKFTKDMVKEAKKHGYNLSFTGHSLGAFLAELSVFYCHKDFKYPQASAITFDSPGGGEILSTLQPNPIPNEIQLKDFDIIDYVSYPNIINTFGKRIGTIYHVNLNLSNYDQNNPKSYTEESHCISGFIEHLSNNHNSDTLFIRHMVDWPQADWDGLINHIKGSGGTAIINTIDKISLNPLTWVSAASGVAVETCKFLGKFAFYTYFNNPLKQEVAYFKHVSWDEKNKSFNLVLAHDGGEDSFSLTYNAHYQPDEEYDPRLTLPLKHFSKGMQKFLLYFNEVVWGIKTDNAGRQRLVEKWKDMGIPAEITTYLVGLRIETSGSGKHIVSLKDVKFPEIMSVAPIYKFRFEFSKYLAENPDKIREILSAVDQNDTIYAALVGENANVEKIISAFYIGVHMPVPTVDDKIKLLEFLHNKKIPIRSYVVAPGAKVGTIQGGVYVGVNFAELDLKSIISHTFTFEKKEIETGGKQETQKAEVLSCDKEGQCTGEKKAVTGI